MEESLGAAYVVHPGNSKMYQYMKCGYWWNNIKRKIADFISKCLIYQLVNAEHQKPTGQLLDILGWK